VNGVGYVTEEDLLSRAGSSPERAAKSADLLGDEIILYRSRGIPVVVDTNRRRAADLALKLFSATHVLLDDAFQNHSLTKDVDIVLLDAGRPFGDGRLLPLGTLREPPSAIGRADVVIFTRAHEERVPHEAEKYVGGKHLFFAKHEPVDFIGRAGERAPLSFLKNRPCILFSGVARPQSFEETIVALGGLPHLVFRFIDHYRYTEGDIRRIIREAGSGALFITTEKDWAKACDLFPRDAGILALRIEMRISRVGKLIDILANSSSEREL
jgi:tetraacyldisaccharide 4'-kinase